jgi:hypothetical protein
MPRRNLLSTTASIVPPSNSDSVESKGEAPGIGHNGGPPLTPGSDIVWGLEGIATEINRTVPQVRWLIGQAKCELRGTVVEPSLRRGSSCTRIVRASTRIRTANRKGPAFAR